MTRAADIGGLRLAYETFGDEGGRPLVLRYLQRRPPRNRHILPRGGWPKVMDAPGAMTETAGTRGSRPNVLRVPAAS